MESVNHSCPRRTCTDHASLLSAERTLVLCSAGSAEDRSNPEKWRAAGFEVAIVQGESSIAGSFSLSWGDVSMTLAARAPSFVRKHLHQLVELTGCRRVIVDITCLGYFVWAAAVRGLLDIVGVDVFCAYAEPNSYARSQHPDVESQFALSAGFEIEGLRQLPGFSRLDRDDTVVVAMLGFEGNRLLRLIDATSPANDGLIPLLGLPGFSIEYPFFALDANRQALLDVGEGWKQLRYVDAACPFCCFQALKEVHQSYQRALRVGLVGTRPHALGALLYYLVAPESVELIYDYPRPSAHRTEGVRRIHVYSVGAFLRHVRSPD